MRPARNRSDRPVNFPVLPVFRSCYWPVQRSRLFLRCLNGFSCIRRTSAPVNRLYFLRGIFRRARGSRRPSPVFRRHNRTSSRVRIFHCFHCSSHCFFIVSHCSRAGGFLPVPSRRCIVFRIKFPLQIACIYFPRGFPANALDARPARCLNRGRVRRKNTVPARTSERILIRIGFVRRGSEIG